MLSPEQCEECLTRIWGGMESCRTGIDRSDPSTWTDRNFIPALPGQQSASLWHVRGLPEVRRAWATAWETEDLLVAFNTAYVWRPYGIDPSWKPPGLSYHIDRQPFPRDGLSVGIPTSRFGHHKPEYFQGFVSLVRGSPCVGGNTLIPGSHAQYAEFVRDFGSVEKGLPVSEIIAHRPEVFERGIVAHVEQGDALLWDDRTLHGNCTGIVAPAADSPLFKPQLARAGAVVNMSPKRWASPEALETRRIATERGVGNGHRSHHPIDRERLEEPAQRDEADAAAWALREWLRKGGEAKVAGRTTNGGVYAQKRVPAPPLTPYQWSLVC